MGQKDQGSYNDIIVVSAGRLVVEGPSSRLGSFIDLRGLSESLRLDL